MKNNHIIELIENKFGDFIVFSKRFTPNTVLYVKNKKVIKTDYFTNSIQEEVNIVLSRLKKPIWDMQIDEDMVEEVIIDEHGFWQFTLKL